MGAEDVQASLNAQASKYGGHVLGPEDFVGQTFYIADNAMLGFTLFFFSQVMTVPRQWQASVSIAGMVTAVAWYNYTFMKEQWVELQQSPTVYRYTDWLITVPLQICEFYMILRAAGPVSSNLGFRMLTASVGMILFGWMGEVNVMAKLVAFVAGMVCWLYILYEVFSGEASAASANLAKNPAAQSAFNTLRLIVSVGWCMYPIGYAMVYLFGPAPYPGMHSEEILNVTYNLADLVNKGAFGMCVWAAARGAVPDNAQPLLS